MATLGPEARKALRQLREHKSVLEVTYNWYEIRVKFLTGIRENWILHERPDRRRQYSMPFPKNGWWSKKIPTFSEFQSKPFDDAHNELIEPFFKVQYMNIMSAGFMDQRIKVHELTQQLFEEGWVEPRYPKEALKEDFKRVCDSSTNKATHSLNHVSAYPSEGVRQPGAVVLSHFAPDWGDFKEPNRETLRRGWKKNVLYRCISRLLKLKYDITRTELIRAVMAFASKKHGPLFVPPIYYRGLVERIFKLENPTILDPTPAHGSLAVGLAAQGGTMLYEPDSRFEKFCDGLSDFLGIPIREYSGEPVDAVIFGTVLPLGLEDIKNTLKKYRDKAEHIACVVKRVDKDKIVAATNPKRVLEAQVKPIRKDVDNLLIY